MRKLLGIGLVALATVVAGQGQAADFPDYPPVDVPDVDVDLGGSFYLRGSAAFDMMRGQNITYLTCVACGGTAVVASAVTGAGYGYSFGAGFGYETGDGLRVDTTLDYLVNNGMTDGTYTLNLRSTLALANVYWDFKLGDMGMGDGALGAYVGAGIGAAYNQTHITGGPAPGPDGAVWEAAAAAMAGVTYDMGDWVADLGYRMIYMPEVTNGQVGITPPNLSPYWINNVAIHELRGTLRYRFN